MSGKGLDETNNFFTATELQDITRFLGVLNTAAHGCRLSDDVVVGNITLYDVNGEPLCTYAMSESREWVVYPGRVDDV